MAHFYNGGGRAVTLQEIGHLREIAAYYAHETRTEGAYRRLAGQIASEARKNGPGSLTYEFEGSYDFKEVEFSHGGGQVFGVFVGSVEDRGSMYAIRGMTTFNFADVFTDPLGIGWEAGGTAYDITGRWTAGFTAEVFKDASRSDFFTE